MMRNLLPHENIDHIFQYGEVVFESGWRNEEEACYDTLYEYGGEFYLHVYSSILGQPEKFDFVKHLELDSAVRWLDAAQKETIDHGIPTTNSTNFYPGCSGLNEE